MGAQEDGREHEQLQAEMLEHLDDNKDGRISFEEFFTNREKLPVVVNKLLTLVRNVPEGGSINYQEVAVLHLSQEKEASDVLKHHPTIEGPNLGGLREQWTHEQHTHTQRVTEAAQSQMHILRDLFAHHSRGAEALDFPAFAALFTEGFAYSVCAQPYSSEV